jgi:hypothetical protein
MGQTFKEMKINKTHFALRLITFPIKLVFTLLWHLLIGVLYSVKWLKHGGQELYYSNEHGGNLVKLIESNEKLIDALGYKDDDSED